MIGGARARDDGERERPQADTEAGDDEQPATAAPTPADKEPGQDEAADEERDADTHARHLRIRDDAGTAGARHGAQHGRPGSLAPAPRAGRREHDGSEHEHRCSGEPGQPTGQRVEPAGTGCPIGHVLDAAGKPIRRRARIAVDQDLANEALQSRVDRVDRSVGHRSASSRTVRRVPIARWRRDFTVPSGIPASSAICGTVRSP